MERTDFSNMECPIARALERVGEWWSILILRDAFYGRKRFDEFQKSLGIAPNMLTRRLKGLVDSGLLEKRLYNEKPARYEYVLTDKGRDFRPVMLSLMSWGNKHFAPAGPSIVLANTQTGVAADLALIDRITGDEIKTDTYRIAPGPAASEGMKQRIFGARK